jgi:hypothetical protein
MSDRPITQFGKREAALAVQRAGPTKRSGHVALLLAGTVAVGGGAYALMPGENCAPSQPGMAAPANAGCSPRGSSSGGGGSSRYGFTGGDFRPTNRLPALRRQVPVPATSRAAVLGRSRARSPRIFPAAADGPRYFAPHDAVKRSRFRLRAFDRNVSIAASLHAEVEDNP